MRRVAITGIGIVSPIGIGVRRFWRSAMNGKSGVRRISAFDVSRYPTQFAGDILDFDPSMYMRPSQAKRMSKAAQYALAAAVMAQEDAGLTVDESNSDDTGIALGVSMSGMDKIEPEIERFYERGPGTASPYLALASYPGASAGNISVELKVRGESVTIATGCSSATNAIGYAFRAIRRGVQRAMFTGGSEVCVTPFLIETFSRSRALSERNASPAEASRPFDRGRDGFVLGDGAAILILEDLDLAKKRDARIYAEVVGYGSTSDAYSMRRIDPEGGRAVQAIAKALKGVDICPDQIDYVCAHGSSAVVTDRRETKVIKRSLGAYARKVPVSSLKSMIGHPLGACGGFQTSACALAIAEGEIPPTINYVDPDPECDLDYVPNVGRQRKAAVALNLSLGMGGNNACLALKAV
jgi:3-oxoacyl-[acyl-carrier-protein] synthase II